MPNTTDDTNELGLPYGKMLPRANDFYHGVTSIKKHGVIAHTSALAQGFIKSGEAKDEVDAMAMAIGEVHSIQRTAKGRMPNRDAHLALNAQQTAASRSTEGHALPSKMTFITG